MAPDKKWMQLIHNRLDDAYIHGVEIFLNYTFTRLREANEIRCPCVKCCNAVSRTREIVRSHLIVHGIIQNYTFWYHHGETIGETEEPDSESVNDDDKIGEDHEEDEIHDILTDLHPFYNVDNMNIGDDDVLEEEPNPEAKRFYSLLKDFDQPLYEGSKLSKLSTLVKLLHIKSIGRWSNNSFNMLLKMLKKDLLPDKSNLPDSYYEARKLIKSLGLSYDRIDACRNDCMLYWKNDKFVDSCKICGASRWKEDKHNGESKIKKGKKIPYKILRYFPLKTRLQRLFMSSKTSPLMRWHHENKANDGIMRHPVDSKAWKKFDELHQSFAMEPRNVRLGLASDGFQPFGCSRTPYSIWPVVLIPYNLPPLLCMKQENFILSMLIPGPGSPGDAIDVYLQPLIDELKELWETGVCTFDASIKRNFTLHAALLWTINDFPAYGNLSGWSTKGKLACPCCNRETFSKRLTNGKKQCYMGHRRFLPLNHKWRNDKKSFDGTAEWGLPPNTLSGEDTLDQVADLDGLPLTNDQKKKIKVSHDSRGDNWNKKSIFFDLPYWKTLLLRHNLDVMHIEKNICDNILGTILNIKGKTKDTLSSRLDLQELKIMKELHPKRNGEKYDLPTACFTLSPEEKHKFLSFLKDLKVPDGFSSNISHCINMKDHKISGLKSHDCHVLLQHLIPLAIRSMLCIEVREPLIELSLFFNLLGAKCLKLEELEQIEAQIPETLCKLEKVFIPAFFDVMEHLPIHLANEAMIGGPVQYRSMYPVERWLYFLKLFIRNKSCVEGSIAEGYIANEFTTLCSRYLHTMETKFNLLERNYDGGALESDGGLMIFCQPGRALKGGKTQLLNLKELEQAHIYILKNCDEVQPFLEEFSQIPGDSSEKNSDRQFISWFKGKIEGLSKHDESKKMVDLLTLSRGPMKYVTRFKGYIINGYRFHVQDYDKGLRTQNCGIVVAGETDEEGKIIDYYGDLTDILELQFIGGRRLVLFRCMWFDVYDNEMGVKMDKYDFVSVNPQRFLKTDEPFVLANQASQVFYARDHSNKGWNVVRKFLPRDTFDDMQKNDNDFEDLHYSIDRKRKRTHPEKEIRHNSTSGGFVKESTVRGSVEKRTMVGNNKGLNSATYTQNVVAQKINVVPPGFDALEDETSFPNDDLEVMQETVTSKPAKENGQNIISACSVKGSNVVQRTSIGKNYCVPSSDKNELAQNKNLMQPGFDPIEVDSFFPRDDLEVMGRGNRFTSLSSVREGIEKRIMIENNKGLNSAIYDQNVIPQKTNVVCPDFDAIKVETSFPHDDYEVMQENMRSIPGKENRKNITSVGSARGSIFVQRTSIGKSKGYSVVSSDMNVPASNKIIRQPNFNPIEHDTSFPHDDLEAMQEALRSKSDPMEDDLTLPQDEVEVMQDTQISKEGSCEVDRIKKVRGPNLCKVVTGLKPGEKLRVTFYHNRVVGDHHALFSRHLGSLVRDRNMCPLRVHSWTDIEEAKLEHMWGAVTEKFDSDDMIGHRDHVLKHMRRLWNNWRGSLHMNMKSKPLREVLKDVPEGVDKSDWEWLVKDHFLSAKFKEKSTRNAMNRSKLSMPHRTGSKPIREIIYELGGKHGNPPDMATIFFETRKKDNKLLEPETNQKYEEIQELLQVEPSLTNIEVVERCFGPQSKSHVVGFGGGITSKDLKGGSSAKAALLEQLNVSRKEKAVLLEELNASRKENESMKRRMDNIEKRCEIFESAIFRDPSSPPSSSEQNTG
ncbi:hypothetical protein MTR67_033834 [Solanum verrucosum]|uniref:Uncharacterized protein n=1 Tax=Solanum verrucosum TaxID=315347 RepID=A0AAF0U794_SOLVR|nr:hypothetical protein MTR67_033834 [Solanum verrucosum]